MAQRNDSAEMPMTFVSETGAPSTIETEASLTTETGASLTTETEASLTIEVSLVIADKTYVKAILKNEIKVIKLNSDNYQNWANEMQLLLNAKKLWSVVGGLKKFSDRVFRSIDYKDWKFDDAQTKA